MEVRVFDKPPPAGVPRPSPPVHLRLADGLLAATQAELRQRSDLRREALVLWAGRPSQDAIDVTHLVLPRFISRRDYLTLPASERHRLVDWLRQNELLVFCDLHTHPGRAFLSAADIAAPFSSRDGFYAIVVPDFASGATAAGWRMYEARDGRWAEVLLRERIRGLSI